MSDQPDSTDYPSLYRKFFSELGVVPEQLATIPLLTWFSLCEQESDNHLNNPSNQLDLINKKRSEKGLPPIPSRRNQR